MVFDFFAGKNLSPTSGDSIQAIQCNAHFHLIYFTRTSQSRNSTVYLNG